MQCIITYKSNEKSFDNTNRKSFSQFHHSSVFEKDEAEYILVQILFFVNGMNE